MAKLKSVLFVASEVFPFVKVSKAADYSSSLPLALKEKGLDVRIMMPKYGHISERKNRIHDINRLRDMPVPINDSDVFATIKSSSISNSRSKVQTYITTNDEYFNQLKGVFSDLKTGEEFPNNAERFIFFSRSVVETCVLLEWYPEIIHCHNWQTALIPAMARILYPNKFKNTKFVLTIDDFENQGEFSWSNYKRIGLDSDHSKDFKHKNKFNFLKPGLIHTDYITTVSKTYAKQLLKDQKLLNGLGPILKDRSKVFEGILTKIDHWIWHKSKDDYLEHKIEDDDFENFKYNNKVSTVTGLELEYHPKTPLFIINEFLKDNMGFEQFFEIADEVLQKDVHFVIYGDGNADIKSKIKDLEEKYPGKIKLIDNHDEYKYHTLIAGGDFLIVNRNINNDALNFMYATTYGTLPVARKTGAIEEIIEVWDGEVDGFALEIKDDKAKSLKNAIDEAIKIFEDKEAFNAMQNNCSYEEFGWGEDALAFEEIYKKLLK